MIPSGTRRDGQDVGTSSASADAVLAAVLFAVDPAAIGGIVLAARLSPAREAYLAWLIGLLGLSDPPARIGPLIGEDRLFGGVDVARSLIEGRAVRDVGLLEAAAGRPLILTSAERVDSRLAAHLARAMDQGHDTGSGLALVAIDERADDDEGTPPALMDRLGIHVPFDAGDLVRLPPEAFATVEFDASDVRRARARLAAVATAPKVIEGLTGAALQLGIRSVRAPLLALRLARAHAALDDRREVTEDDVAVAARLVLLPRATQLPAPPEANDQPPPPEPDSAPNDTQPTDAEIRAIEDVILDAAKSALSADALAALATRMNKSRNDTRGRSDSLKGSRSRGRPKPSIAGALTSSTRLDLIATLRAAAPWQPLRRRMLDPATAPRVIVRRSDFRIRRFDTPQRRTTVFVVDASGSAALHRLAETKGAVETLLADSYVRRDQVALIAFRQDRADVLLPPTRALTRAKRALSGLPGGGTTPLAGGLEAAHVMLQGLRRRGEDALAVVMTDGRGNVARDGRKGRTPGDEDAQSMAAALKRANFDALVIDTSHRPDAAARRLADAMGAAYLPLPYADASTISRAVAAAQRA